jgi:RHS repeat-associated protein
LINNYQGSPVVVLDNSQNIKYQKYLDPWGNLEMEIGSPSSNIEFQYTDKELDEDTDLYYFQARYYDPVRGGFPSRDKVKLEDNLKNYFGINAYVFTNNNPVRNVDPDGMESFQQGELDLYKKIGISKYGVGLQAKQAINVANRVAQQQGWHINEVRNGRTDAYRHAYFAASLKYAYGQEKAGLILDAHEHFGTSPGDEMESIMDAYNNSKGLEFDVSMKSVQGQAEVPNANTIIGQDIENAVLNMVNSGKLKAFADYDNYLKDMPSTRLVTTKEIPNK